MNKIKLIIKALFLDKDAIKELSAPKHNWRILASVITLILGIYYGFTSITINSGLISELESPQLREQIVPALFFFFGYFMIVITKAGLTLLLWAGAKGLRGPGLLSILYRYTTIALIPSLIALPAFISIQVGNPISMLMIISVVVAVAWIYLVCARVLEVTQQFLPWKGYLATFMAFVFFISVFYMVLPPTS